MCFYFLITGYVCAIQRLANQRCIFTRKFAIFNFRHILLINQADFLPLLETIKNTAIISTKDMIAVSLKQNYFCYFLCISSETVNTFLPLARRAAKTRRPFAVAMRSRNPCLFLRLVFDGWNVLFIAV